ncbi:succinyl-diaminopimelate desuccinylase [Helicobacter bizzozeronii]|uniref:succinyl-diaminopimelate desuccinylase n=1 Tax=Helicobacter bizzozeronii TaxID=56877 RepID=UPI000CEF1DE6|nr:succinyl-diaminopimelate desuccinylase [Helicobacter bizzozeronii]
MNPLNVVWLARELITFKTITPQEEGIFDFIQSLFPGFEVVRADKEGVKNLFLYKRLGACDNPLHFCFAGHIDVVPAGEGWSIDPFGGVIEDGFLYGRGAQDMKGGVAALLCAVHDFCKQENPPDAIISILLTSDEEGEARYGTQYMLEVLQEQNLLPHFALVAEPTSAETLGDSVKIGRRGSVSGQIIVNGISGHVAYPKTCLNPIDLIADKLMLISGALLDKGDDFFAPSKLVITTLKSVSQASNVTPKTLEIRFNVRNSPLTSAEHIQEFLDTILAKVPCDIELITNSKPFLSSQDSPLAMQTKRAILETLQITPEFNTKGGTSDARFLRAFGVEVVEFGLLNDRIHALDERVALSDLEKLQQVFLRLLHLILKD